MARTRGSSRPTRRRRFERALVGVVMAMIAFVIERVVLRNIKRTATPKTG